MVKINEKLMNKVVNLGLMLAWGKVMRNLMKDLGCLPDLFLDSVELWESRVQNVRTLYDIGDEM